jgi:hypothetical protein
MARWTTRKLHKNKPDSAIVTFRPTDEFKKPAVLPIEKTFY